MRAIVAGKGYSPIVVLVQFTASGACGDPQFYGFQGQHFDVHGMPDGVFSLYSSLLLQVNSRFVYLSSGDVSASAGANGLFWTHPGTYFGEIGLLINGQMRSDSLIAFQSVAPSRVRVMSGSLESGLSVFVNEVEERFPFESTFIVQNTHKTRVEFLDAKTVLVSSDDVDVTISNSDDFVNLGFSFKNSSLLDEGQKCENHAQLKHSLPHPRTHRTDLLRPNLRKWKLCQGDVDEYMVKDLFAHDDIYNRFVSDA